MASRSSEENLILRVKESEEGAFFQLFEKYHLVLYRLAHYRCRDHALAEEITQEVFLKIWLKREILNPELPLWPLLARMCRNLVQDHFRANAVRVRYGEEVSRDSERRVADPETELCNQQPAARIAEVIQNEIDETYQTAFLLNRVGGLSHQEIADLLCTTKKTVENRIYRALKMVREKCLDYL